MKRLLQFRLHAPILLLTFSAIAWAFFLPFDPDVMFGAPSRSSYSAVDGTNVPTNIVSITNKGHFSVWYPGYDGTATNYSWIGDPQMGDDNWYGHSIESTYWTRLRPGESTAIELPLTPSHDTYKIGVQLQDWRGRTADCWSDIIDAAAE